MAVYITGDLHGEISINRLSFRRFPKGRHLSRSDFLAIAGDFGLIWDGSRSDNFWLDWLDAKPWTTLFIDGNHENFDLLESYPIVCWNGGKARKIRSNIYHLMRGQVYTLCGHKFFTFGGASSTDKEYRVEGKTWWARELPDEEEFREALESLSRYQNSVDYVITHTCPISTLYTMTDALGLEPQIPDVVNVQLEAIRRRISYKKWFFGHFHFDAELPGNMQVVYNKILKIC